nr:unnamed protein product [Spirometra erinaceieuropaei]
MCLLGEEGTDVEAEEGCSTSGWWTINSFDRGEEILRFVAVRVSLDLLSLKAKTAVESSSVDIGGAVDVGFVLAVLPGEQVADGGVVANRPRTASAVDMTVSRI